MNALAHPRPVPAADEHLGVGLGHPGGVDHHPLGDQGAAGQIAVVVGEKLLGQRKFHSGLLCPPSPAGISFYAPEISGVKG